MKETDHLTLEDIDALWKWPGKTGLLLMRLKRSLALRKRMSLSS